MPYGVFKNTANGGEESGLSDEHWMPIVPYSTQRELKMVKSYDSMAGIVENNMRQDQFFLQAVKIISNFASIPFLSGKPRHPVDLA